MCLRRVSSANSGIEDLESIRPLPGLMVLFRLRRHPQTGLSRMAMPSAHIGARGSELNVSVQTLV